MRALHLLQLLKLQGLIWALLLFWQCESFSPSPPLLRYPLLGPPVCALSHSSLSAPSPSLPCPCPLPLFPSVPSPTLPCPHPPPLFPVRALPHSSLSAPSP